MLTLRREWAAFPLFLVKDGKCQCSEGEQCTAAGKHPAYAFSTLKKGEKVKGRDGCGYGIATGERSDCIVVDFDTWEAFEAMADKLPNTYAVRTARGVHLYYRWPGFRVRNSAGELAPGVDVRGDGGFAVAPGSLHKTGKLYEEVPGHDRIEDAPAWLLEWPGLRAKERTTAEAGDNAPIPVDIHTDEGQAIVKNGIYNAQQWTASVQGQGGSSHLFSLALFLVRDLELPLETCATLIAEYYNPRCAPPWSDEEIWHKLEDARDKSDRMPGGVAFGEGFKAIAEATAARELAEVVAAKVAPGPHEYTFDPENAVRMLQYVQNENGETRVKKPYKPEIDEVVFDLNTEKVWAGVFRYNELDDHIYAFRPPFRLDAEKGATRLSDADLTGMRVWWLNQKYGVVRSEDLASAVERVAKRHRFHPVREYLTSLTRTTLLATRHLDNLAATLFGDERPIAQEYVRKQLVAACARAFEPGCRVDTVLTLCGIKGGEQKSTTIKELHNVPGYDVFRTDLPELKDFQKVGQALEGCWVAELAELACARKSDVETLKATLTRCVEKYSPKYVKGEIARPRNCVFWASTNDLEFLPRADPALRRRFWTIHVHKRIDLDWLRAHRAEIWAEAMALYRSDADERWWYRDEDVADVGRQEFIGRDSWEQLAREAFERLDQAPDGGTSHFTSKDVYFMICGADAHAPSNADLKKVNEAMAGLSYPKISVKGYPGWRAPYKKG